MADVGEKICFVVAPIGDLESEIRKRSDQILKHVIQPAARACGYKAMRADKISEPGMITTQVIQHILKAPMVVADLTDSNPNVFYELALRHAFRMPYVQLIQKGQRIPFDVANVRTIEIDHRDLDSVEAAKEEIIKQMRSMQGKGSKIDSPISTAVDLDTFRQSDNPEQRQLAGMLSTMVELKEKQEELSGLIRKLLNSGRTVVFSQGGTTQAVSIPPLAGISGAIYDTSLSDLVSEGSKVITPSPVTIQMSAPPPILRSRRPKKS